MRTKFLLAGNRFKLPVSKHLLCSIYYQWNAL